MGDVSSLAKLYLFIGRTGTGKTVAVKKFIEGIPDVIIFDVNNEYDDSIYDTFYNPDFGQAIQEIKGMRDKVIVIEDATKFFTMTSRTNTNTFKSSLVSKRHENNNFILLFHNLFDVPQPIFNMADTVILFHTLDNISSVKAKYGGNKRVLEGFLTVQEKGAHDYVIINR